MIEVIASECAIALGVMLSKVPYLGFWDVLFGEPCDAFTQGNIFIDLATRGRFDPHVATPCQSFTFARKPALRNASEPLGKPGLSRYQPELVEKGNELAAWTITRVKAVHAADGYFSMENLYLS